MFEKKGLGRHNSTRGRNAQRRGFHLHNREKGHKSILLSEPIESSES